MELRFISRDGNTLTFESPDGLRHTALLDEDLAQALRPVTRNQAAEISPREIQARLRAGESVDALALELGVSASSLEPFAAPILDELRFMLEAALSVQMADGNQMSAFGEILDRDHKGAARRIYRQSEQWLLEVNSDSTMIFRFDPRNRVLEPLDSSATNLTLLHSQRDLVTATLPAMSEPAPVYSEERYESVEQTASVLDLVEELRARRQLQEQTVRPSPAKGRTSLPSWDEIVLGASNSEADADKRDF
jgi:transposase-like protein